MSFRFVFVGKTFRKSDPTHRWEAGGGGARMWVERGREDLIGQEDYRLKLQKLWACL